jgi:serine/threonine-protein kinase
MAASFPTSFGKYILLKPLARGGMGEIYLALTGELGGFEKLCVIKRVRASAHSDSAVRRFLDEAKVVIKLSHGNLVQVFDAGFVDDEIYLAMEYVEGRDLRDILVKADDQRIRIPVEVALYVAAQICRGLDYAHGYGNLNLVHRDICPSNVLVSFTGEVKVTDFGLAQSKLKEEQTEPGKVFGRFSYLAPEQARREEIDHRADLYATAIILWELLTGEQMRPGPHTDPGLALQKVRTGKITPPSARNPRIAPDLDAVVVKGLQGDPSKRYESAEEMRRAIAKSLSRLNPTFDAGGVAEFMRQVYGDVIEATREERERLLTQNYDRLRKPSSLGMSARLSASGRLSSGGLKPSSGRRPGEPENLAGQIVDNRYRVVRLIGEGGMGGVYEAEHVEIGRRVAVKILHAIFSSHPETVARFRAEARAATRIGHPNIVEVTDSGTTEDGRVFFVMELLSGVDLARVMADDRIVPAQRALPITLQICRALHAAHEAGIVHRDLKPENIFLTVRDGQPDFVKILDFGIAKNVELREQDDRLTHPGIAMGTPEYMAPEQAAGKDVDRRIDVYATGALLYEMLTGHLPHEGENLMQILSKKASHPPVAPREYRPDMPEGLERVLLRALSAEPAQRFQTMEALAEALAPYGNGAGSAWELTEEHVAPSLDARIAREQASRSSRGAPTVRPSASVPAVARGASGAVVVSAETAFDPTMASPLPSDPARTVSPGEVILADHVQSEAIARVRMGTGAPTPVPGSQDQVAQGLAATQMVPALRLGRRRWLLYGGAALAGIAGVAIMVAIFWPRSDPGTTVVAPRGPDLARPRADAGAPVKKQPPPKAKLTPEEVARLLEWAKRAAEGGRIISPKGDNALELIERVEGDYPEHPQALALRQQLCVKLKAAAAKATRKRQYATAEHRLQAWMALEPLAASPKRQLFAIYLAQARLALGKGKLKPAADYVKSALALQPQSPSAIELRGDLQVKRRKWPLAAKDYEAVLESDVSKAFKKRVQQKLKAVRKKIR